MPTKYVANVLTCLLGPCMSVPPCAISLAQGPVLPRPIVCIAMGFQLFAKPRAKARNAGDPAEKSAPRYEVSILNIKSGKWSGSHEVELLSDAAADGRNVNSSAVVFACLRYSLFQSWYLCSSLFWLWFLLDLCYSCCLSIPACWTVLRDRTEVKTPWFIAR